MESTFYFGWEADYLEGLQRLFQGSVLQNLFILLNNLFSAFGEEMICIIVLGLVYWGINKEIGKRLGLVIITANVSNGMMKNIFHRLRPYQVLDRVELLRKVGGYSFPSGHSANAAAMYPTLAYEFKGKKLLKYVACILPLLIAFSRNYLGAHWPTDVIVGLLQGLLCMIAVEYLSRRIQNSNLLRILFLLITCTGLFYCRTEDYFTSLGLMIGFTFAVPFEEKLVQFENTTKWYLVALRTACGCVLYLLLNVLLKLVLNGWFEADTMGAFAMRTIRYALIIFLLLGVYPISFRLFSKKKEQ